MNENRKPREDEYQMGNMAPEDYKIAQELCRKDPEFAALWEEHFRLKAKLKELESKPFRTSREELEVKQIKKLKLRGKDLIADKIRAYKVGVGPPR